VVPAAGIYARISHDPEGDQLGVTRQLADCRALAAARGWQIVDEYVDDDRSAYSGRPRPEYRRLLDDLDQGVINAVVVYDHDRLHRQPRELEAFLDLCDARGVRDLATVSGMVDLGTDEGRFHARIVGAVARKSSDDTSRRIRRKHQELALAGKPGGGGNRPFGYRADRLTVLPSEAAIVRDLVRRVLAGESIRSLAVDLDRRGIPTTTGRPSWSIQTLKRMLRSPRLAGQRAYHDEIVAVGGWEAIITAEESARVRAVLDERGQSRRRDARRYLLAGGLLRCGLCEAVLVSRPAGDGTRRYVCAKGPGLAGCGRIATKADPIEALLVEAVLYRLDSPEMAAILDGRVREDAPTAAIQAELDIDREQLVELARVHGERQITLPEWLAARKPIEARVEMAQRRLSRLSSSAAIDDYVGSSDALRAAWIGLPLSRQRAAVAAVLDHAVVRPAGVGGGRFDPDRVVPVWRA
jgi:DNA invertase Pin-like site-specific DNA recombinase